METRTPVSGGDPQLDPVTGWELVLRPGVLGASRAVVLAGEYNLEPHQGSWLWGPGSQTTASGSSGLAPLTQALTGTGFAAALRLRATQVLGHILVPESPSVPISGAGTQPSTDSGLVPRDGASSTIPPVLVDGGGAPMVPPTLPADEGASGVASGPLQSEVLTELISAVITGVASIARAAFSGQQFSGDAASGSGGDWVLPPVLRN